MVAASACSMAMAGPAVEGVAVVGEDEGGAELEGVQELKGQGGGRGQREGGVREMWEAGTGGGPGAAGAGGESGRCGRQELEGAGGTEGPGEGWCEGGGGRGGVKIG